MSDPDIALLVLTFTIGVTLALRALPARPTRQDRRDKAVLEALADHPLGLSVHELHLTTRIATNDLCLSLIRLHQAGRVRAWDNPAQERAHPRETLYGLAPESAVR